MSIEEFYSWFKKLGGTISPHHIKQLEPSFQTVPEPISSFKSHPNEIKRKYNYKFKDRPLVDESLSEFPDINSISYERIQNDHRV